MTLVLLDGFKLDVLSASSFAMRHAERPSALPSKLIKLRCQPMQLRGVSFLHMANPFRAVSNDSVTCSSGLRSNSGFHLTDLGCHA